MDKILAIIVIVNIGLSALSAGLDKFLEMKSDENVSKVSAIVKKAASILKGIVDFISANRAH